MMYTLIVLMVGKSHWDVTSDDNFYTLSAALGKLLTDPATALNVRKAIVNSNATGQTLVNYQTPE